MFLRAQGIDEDNSGVGRVRRARGLSNDDEGVGRGREIRDGSEASETKTEATGARQRARGIYDADASIVVVVVVFVIIFLLQNLCRRHIFLGPVV